MAIEREVIDRVKRIDLVALVQAKGIELKKNGKGWFGLCPFHADKTPSLSINPNKNLWQCFGCGASGDTIRFVELFDQVDFKEAVQRLSNNGFKIKPSKDTPVKTKQLTVKEKKLLARVVSYYQHCFTRDSRGLNYLKQERGIRDNQSFTDFGAGYVNGTLLEILPYDPDVIAALKKIGILNEKGHEMFYNCVVFPLLSEGGDVVSLYGRRVDDEPGSAPDAGIYVRHLYLSGPRFGLVNRQAVKRSETLILTESIIDALTLYDRGFKNVMPIYGVNGLLDEHLLFFNSRIKTAYLAFDADEAGRQAAEAVSLRLKEKDIESFTVSLPEKDVNLYFKSHGPEAFEQLLKAAGPDNPPERAEQLEQRIYNETEHGSS